MTGRFIFSFRRGFRYSLGSITIKEDHSVTDAVSKPDDAYVNITEATVAALYSGGFIATDGSSNINVYLKATPEVKIGDLVSIKATKITYNGLPELISPTVSVLSSGNEVPRSELKNVTAVIDSYDSNIADYVCVLGKLIKDGDYWYVSVPGASRMATISALHESFDIPSALEGKRVLMKGYFNSIRYDSLLIVVTEIIDAEPEAVDLGLPSGIMWASFNVGATKPEEYGEYYAWGETQPKSDYSWSTYKWCSGDNNKLTKYCTDSSYWGDSGSPDNKTVLNPEDDAAQLNWGGSWRIPTDAEWKELVENCTWTWTKNYNGTGIKGRIVTASNGNSIFLPAAGYWNATYVDGAGGGGTYWSSTLNSLEPNYSLYVGFSTGIVSRSSYERYFGFSIRPVCPKD